MQSAVPGPRSGMKTVPTLCATGTIGVAAVGLTLGKLDTPGTASPLLPGKRKLENRHDFVELHMSSDLATRYSSRTSTPSSASRVFSDISEPAPSLRSHQNEGDLRPIKSRKYTEDQSASGATSHDNGHRLVSTNRDLLEPHTPAQTPLSKWKRLSSLTLSSLSSTPSSLRRDSRSISFSNTSSTPLFAADQSPKAILPNKLVKRSLSQRDPSLSSPGSFRSRIPTRRTTTSNYCSSPALESAANYDERENIAPPQAQREPPASGHEQWLQYFSARFGKLNMNSQKSRLTEPSNNRRALPPPNTRPSVPLTGSVNVPISDGTFFTNCNQQTSGRPSPHSSTLRSVSSPIRESSLDTLKAEQRPKRSWSISNLLHISPPNRKSPSTPKSSGTRLTRRTPRKLTVSLAGSPAMLYDDGVDQERPSKRRDVSHSNPPSSQQYFYESNVGVLDPWLKVSRGEYHTPSSLLPNEEPYFDLQKSSPLTQGSPKSPVFTDFDHDPPFAGITHPYNRLSRHSRSPSDPASTLPGSDCGTRVFSSADEDDVDQRSDTVFDSLRTGMTRSSYGGSGHKLETLFDNTPSGEDPEDTISAVHMLAAGGEQGSQDTRDVQQDASQGSSDDPQSNSQTTTENKLSGSFALSGLRKSSGSSNSSSSNRLRPVNASQVAYDADSEIEDDGSSSDVGDDGLNDFNDLAIPHSRTSSPATGEDSSDLQANKSNSAFSTPQRPSVTQTDYEVKNSLFDWSEQLSVEKTSVDSTPPRPKTVHGKKDAESRGSRSTGRRGPSAVHARSQSVPVIPDVTNKKTNLGSKFGTWGIGSKIVTEEWDDDFEFETDNKRVTLAHGEVDSVVDGGMAMFVPPTIRQQQTNVLANIGLLKEWGMLIEELKELRMRATTLGLVVPEHDEVFEQVDAMIDLADQEVEDEGFDTLRSQSSSPGFNSNDFDQSPVPSQSSRSQVRSTRTQDDDIFTTPHSRASRSGASPAVAQDPHSAPLPPTRPRKDSEAVAKSVIELLQKRNRNPLANMPAARTSSGEKKVPFDTATLKHIVPHVNGLMHKMKQILREAEGLQSSPSALRRQTDSPFSHVFADPAEGPTAALKHQNLFARFADDEFQDSFDEEEELDLVASIGSIKTA